MRFSAPMLVLCGVLLATATWPASAQQSLQNFERQLEQIRRETRLLIEPDVPVEQRALIDYGAYLSFYFLAIDDQNAETHILRQTDFNAYARVNIDDVHQFFVRGRVAYRDFNSGDSFNGDGDDLIGPHLERATYRFDLGRYMEAYEGEEMKWDLDATMGRQLVHWANGLVLSQVLDGVLLSAECNGWRIDALAGNTWEEQPDYDASRPHFEDEMDRNWFGGMLSYAVTPQHRPYLYGLVQDDQNSRETFGGASADFEYDSHYIGIGSAGSLTDRLLYGVEIAFQRGEGMSNLGAPPQTEEDIRAWAADFRLDYFLNDPQNSRFSGEVLIASGDDDRLLSTSNTVGGNLSGTDDEAFNAFGLLNTGLAFSPNVSNLIMLRGGASTYPLPGSKWLKRLQIGIDVYVFNKYDGDAPSDEPTDDEAYLGFETDVWANWQVTSDLALSLRYGIFFPGDGIDEAGNDDDDERHFFFSGVTLGF